MAVAVVAAAVLLLVNAGDDDGGQAARPAGERTLFVRDTSPWPDIRLAVGDELEFRNDDDVEHTFTADGGLFDSGRVAPGASFRYSFPAVGELTYHCEIHPSMKGRVIVEGPA